MRTLRVIATAYACEPNTGSETGIGWNVVREVARHEGVDVTVITRKNNRPEIESALGGDADNAPTFVYYDLPSWAGWWKRGRRGLQLYYYLWQIGAARLARRLHGERSFDCAQHVTFGRYWTPSFLPSLGIPFFWGPVGGGETFPRPFWDTFSTRARLYEIARSVARAVGELDPFVRRTARRSSRAFAATRETQQRLRRLGAQDVELLGNAALSRAEHTRLAAADAPADGPLRFVSAGRLLHWKGFDLAVRAFAAADIPDAEYWILGDGPHRAALERLAEDLGVQSRVRFFGSVARDQVEQCLEAAHVMVHPSLHDSGGWAVIEAMATGRPIICLDLGGPAVMVDDQTGFSIVPTNADDAVRSIAQAMHLLDSDRHRLAQMGAAASRRVAEVFSWEAKADQLVTAYRAACGRQAGVRGATNDTPSAINEFATMTTTL